MQGWIEYITDLEYRALELSCAPNPDELLEKEYRITSKRKVTDKKVIRTASAFSLHRLGTKGTQYSREYPQSLLPRLIIYIPEE